MRIGYSLPNRQKLVRDASEAVEQLGDQLSGFQNPAGRPSRPCPCRPSEGVTRLTRTNCDLAPES